MKSTPAKLARQKRYYEAHRAERLAYQKAYAKAHPEESETRRVKSQGERMAAHRSAMNIIKEGGCVDCGSTTRVLHFHHVDPAAYEFRIANGWMYPKRLAAELAKCVVLCEPCHKIRHGRVPDKSLR